MNTTVVYTRGGGRLGNQLLNYANLLAFSLEHRNIDVLDLAFVPYRDEYGNNEMNLALINNTSLPGIFKIIVGIGWGVRGIKQILNYGRIDRFRVQTLHILADKRSNSQSIVGGHTHTGYHIPGQEFDQLFLSNKATVKKLRSREISIIAGWGVRGWPLVRKHRQKIRSRMRPRDSYLSTARSYVSKRRKDYDILIGVLIRQGDYRSWNEGDYFFESKQYEKILSSYADEYPNEKVGFLIASDEEQSTDIFQNDQYNFASGEAVGPNHYLENFAELSLCDIVLTPPSTFSTFAAFLGDVPLVPLYDGVLSDNWIHLEEPLLQSLKHSEMSESIK